MAFDPVLATREEGWHLDEDHPFHTQGTKPKRILTAPSPAPHGSIIAGHRYLYKIAVGWRAQQAWSELIASHLALMLQHPVPPCFIAVGDDDTLGALVQFFYGKFPADPRPAQFVHGAEILSGFHRNLSSGRPNNLRENLRVFSTLLGRYGPWAEWWAATICFDALIGNGDRHTENWGFLVHRDADGKTTYSVAPSYDNGSSLGWELSESALGKLLSSSLALERYISKGVTHIGWDMKSDHEWPHFELCAQLYRSIVATRPVFRDMLDRFDLSHAATLLEQCAHVPVSVPFSRARAEFALALVSARKQRLEAALGL